MTEEIFSKTDFRVKALEEEFARTKSETRQLMLDIRALLMEATSPLRNSPPNGKASTQGEI
jgi:hypothetical protein